MNTTYKPFQRILAIDPLKHGFGWAVLEGDELLVDCGIRDLQAKKPERVLAHIAVLIHRYAPHTIVLENTAHRRCRRGDPARSLVHEIVKMAPAVDIPVSRVSMAKVFRHFRRFGAKNKNAIAQLIADRFPELERLVPPRRRVWMSEDDRMSVFDAMAMALVSMDSTFAEKPQDVVSRIRAIVRHARASSKRGE
jgi:hypothetical protein